MGYTADHAMVLLAVGLGGEGRRRSRGVGGVDKRLSLRSYNDRRAISDLRSWCLGDTVPYCCRFTGERCLFDSVDLIFYFTGE